MARILIVGGGCRGRRLASAMAAGGHAVRVSTRAPEGCEAIAAAGGECWVGTPSRLATLRGALENVTVACWLLGTARGPAEELRELHGSRLEFFLTQAIDTTVRGVVYEAAGSVPAALLAEGAQTVRRLTAFNAIPSAVIETDPGEPGAWLEAARAAVEGLMAAA